MKTSKLSKNLLEVLREIFSLIFHVNNKIESSGMFIGIFCSIILNTFIDKGNLLRIRNGHFQQLSNKMDVLKFYDAIIL